MTAEESWLLALAAVLEVEKGIINEVVCYCLVPSYILAEVDYFYPLEGWELRELNIVRGIERNFIVDH